MCEKYWMSFSLAHTNVGRLTNKLLSFFFSLFLHNAVLIWDELYSLEDKVLFLSRNEKSFFIHVSGHFLTMVFALWFFVSNLINKWNKQEFERDKPYLFSSNVEEISRLAQSAAKHFKALMECFDPKKKEQAWQWLKPFLLIVWKLIIKRNCVLFYFSSRQ